MERHRSTVQWIQRRMLHETSKKDGLEMDWECPLDACPSNIPQTAQCLVFLPQAPSQYQSFCLRDAVFESSCIQVRLAIDLHRLPPQRLWVIQLDTALLVRCLERV